jgi:hypothetical protein
LTSSSRLPLERQEILRLMYVFVFHLRIAVTVKRYGTYATTLDSV